jgi:gluconokinase
MVILLMGVAGSGKTTVGRQLAAGLSWQFADADDFHPPANVAKMSAGQPLDDTDRAPWLAALRDYIEAHRERSASAVLTCSALKERYRQVIVTDPSYVRLVHLHGSRELLWARINSRQNHFMKPAMLDSQLAALEPPEGVLTVDIAPPPAEVAATIRRALSL